jgi:hypothetical protein
MIPFCQYFVNIFQVRVRNGVFKVRNFWTRTSEKSADSDVRKALENSQMHLTLSVNNNNNNNNNNNKVILRSCVHSVLADKNLLVCKNRLHYYVFNTTMCYDLVNNL